MKRPKGGCESGPEWSQFERGCICRAQRACALVNPLRHAGNVGNINRKVVICREQGISAQSAPICYVHQLPRANLMSQTKVPHW